MRIEKLVVLAANHRMFDHWRRRCEVGLYDAVFLQGVDQLRGYQLEPWQVIRYENYWDHPRHQDIGLYLDYICPRCATPDAPTSHTSLT